MFVRFKMISFAYLCVQILTNGVTLLILRGICVLPAINSMVVASTVTSAS